MRRFVSVVVVSLLVGLLTPMPGASGVGQPAPAGGEGSAAAALVPQLLAPGAAGSIDAVDPLTGVMGVKGTDYSLDGRNGLSVSLTRVYRPGRWIGAAACDNGVDDDGDGKADAADVECASTSDDSEKSDTPIYDTAGKPAQYLADKTLWPHQMGNKWAMLPAGLVYHHYWPNPATLNQPDATADYLTYTTPGGEDITLLADKVDAVVPDCVKTAMCSSSDKPVVTATATYVSAAFWKASVTTRYEGRGYGTSEESWTIHRDVDIQSPDGTRFNCQAGVADAKAGYLGKDTYLPYFSTCSSIGDLFGNLVTVRYTNVDDRGFSAGDSPQLAVGPKIDTIVDTYGRTIRCDYDANDLLAGCYLDADGDATASAGERAVSWEYQAQDGSFELTKVHTGRIRSTGSFEGLPTVWTYDYGDVGFGSATKARVLTSSTDYRGTKVVYGYSAKTAAKHSATGGTLTALVLSTREVQGTYAGQSFSSKTKWDYSTDANTLTTTVTQPDGTSSSSAYVVAGDGVQTTDNWGAPSNSTVALNDGGWNKTSNTTDPATPATLTSLTWTGADGNAETAVRRRPPKPTTSTQLEHRGNKTAQVTSSGFDDYGRPAQVVTQEVGADGAPIGIATATKIDYWRPEEGIWLVGDQASSVTTTYGSNTSGATTSTEYDRWGRATRVTANGLVSATTTYDKSGPIRTVTDALGNTTTYSWGSYADQSDPTRTDVVRDALGGESSHTYDIEGRLLSATDRLGRVTSYEYDDEFGRITKVTPPAGDNTHPGLPETSIAYTDATTVRVTVKDRSSEAKVDTLGRLRTTTSPTGVIETTDYATSGALSKITTKDGSTALSEQNFDNQGRPTTTTALAGTTKLVQIESRAYDTSGRLASKTVPNAKGSVTTSYAYDTLLAAPVCTTACAHSVVTTTSYTPTGGSTVAASTSATLMQSVGGEDRVIARSDDNGRTWFTYSSTDSPDPAVGTFDRYGQQRYISGPLGISYRYSYDDHGRPTEQVRSDLAKTTYTYKSGALGETTVVDCTTTGAANEERTDAVVCVDADELNRPKTVTDKTGGSSVELVSYDYSGEDANLAQNPATTTTSVRDGGITYTYTRDVAGRLVQRSSNGAETGWRYDSSGRLARLDYPTGLNLRYGFDAKDRLNSVRAYEGDTLAAEVVSGVAYNTNSTVREINYGNGTKANYGLDDYGMTTTMQAGKTNEILNRSFTYDPAARLTSVTSGTGVERQYTYDNMTGALTSETLGTTSTKNTFALDEMGNRTSLTATSSTTGTLTRTDSYTYDGMRLASASTTPAPPSAPSTAPPSTTDIYTWPTGSTNSTDRTGHLAAVASQSAPSAAGSMTWDRRGRLASFTKTTAETATPAGVYAYAYDDAGERRTKTRPDGTTVTYHRDLDGSLLAESSSNGKTYEYVYGPGGRMARLDTADRKNPIYFLNNSQGSPLAVLDNAGALVQKIDTDAFGNVLSPTLDKLVDRNTFSTYELDAESHLYYAHARYYDSTTGRFLSQDPVTDALRPWDHNPYTYAWANPIAISDPDGRVEQAESQTGTKKVVTEGVESFTGVPFEVYPINIYCAANAAALGIPDLLDSAYAWLTDQQTIKEAALSRIDEANWGSAGFCKSIDVVAGGVFLAHGLWNIAGSIGSGPTLTPALATSGGGGLTSTGTTVIDLARFGGGTTTALLAAPMMASDNGGNSGNPPPPQPGSSSPPSSSPSTARVSVEWNGDVRYVNFYSNSGGGMTFTVRNETGYVDFAVKTGKGTPNGATMWNDAMSAVGDRVRGVYGSWFSADGFRSNLDSFNAAIQAGATPEQAAFQTFTGKMAHRSGFSKVESIRMIGTPDNYTTVYVLFTR